MDISSFLIGYEAGKNSVEKGPEAGSCAINCGHFKGTGTPFVLQHGLHAVPDFVWIKCSISSKSGYKFVENIWCFSEKGKARIGRSNYGQYSFYNSSFGGIENITTSMETENENAFIRNANNETVTIGTNNYPALADYEYYWAAFAGLPD